MAEVSAASTSAAAVVTLKPAKNLELQATGVAWSELDVIAKYDQERLKRLRDDGNAQYIDPSLNGTLTRFQEDPWVISETLNPGLDKAKNGDKFKIVLVGAGYGGLTTASRLAKAGITDITLVDIAGGFGGTWCKPLFTERSYQEIC